MWPNSEGMVKGSAWAKTCSISPLFATGILPGLKSPTTSAFSLMDATDTRYGMENTTATNPAYANTASDFQGTMPVSPQASTYRPMTGRWKDGFCDWHRNCVPSCQVAHRMNYWLRFKEVTGISLGLWCLSYILYSALPRNTNPGGISNLMYALFFLILLCQLRGVVRARYAIPGDQTSDLCVSLWCSCCTLTQMARHVFNYRGNCAECSMGPDAEYLV